MAKSFDSHVLLGLIRQTRHVIECSVINEWLDDLSKVSSLVLQVDSKNH